MTKDSKTIELKVGIFVIAGSILLAVSILLLGGMSSLFERYNKYPVHFEQVDGLIPGARVVLNGIHVGTVDSVEFDSEKQNIRADLLISNEYKKWIRAESTAQIATQGVLGDKFVSINMGDPTAAELPVGAEIRNTPAQDITQFLSSGEELMKRLTSISQSLDAILKNFASRNRSDLFFENLTSSAKNLSKLSTKLSSEVDGMQLRATVQHLKSILEKIDNGKGTLGALVNDPDLYDDAKALFGGANRNRVIRNIIRKTIKDSEEQKPD